MDTTALLANQSIGDPLRDRTAGASTAAEAFGDIAHDELAAARAAIAHLASTRPPNPPGDPRLLVRGLSDRILAAALAGEPIDAYAVAVEEITAYDAAAVVHAAHVVAQMNAQRHLAGIVARNAVLAFRSWTAQAVDLGQTYVRLLDGRPAGTELGALRAGGAAAKRWRALAECRDAYDALVTAWKSLRLLVKPGDRTVFETPARFSRRPAGATWQRALADVRDAGLHTLDLAARWALADALVLDSLADCQRREVEQAAEDKETRNGRGRSTAGAKDIATHDIDANDAPMGRRRAEGVMASG